MFYLAPGRSAKCTTKSKCFNRLCLEKFSHQLIVFRGIVGLSQSADAKAFRETAVTSALMIHCKINSV